MVVALNWDLTLYRTPDFILDTQKGDCDGTDSKHVQVLRKVHMPGPLR
jgi:hypothetical protein